MRENPANKIRDPMWDFLKDGGQVTDAFDIAGLKESVRALVECADRERRERGEVDFSGREISDRMNQVVMNAMALVLSGQIGGEDKRNDLETG